MKVWNRGLCLLALTVRDNKIEWHQIFSEKHFLRVAACGFRLVGHGGGAVWDISRPSVCYPVRGGMVEFVTVGRDKAITVAFRNGTEIQA